MKSSEMSRGLKRMQKRHLEKRIKKQKRNDIAFFIFGITTMLSCIFLFVYEIPIVK